MEDEQFTGTDAQWGKETPIRAHYRGPQDANDTANAKTESLSTLTLALFAPRAHGLNPSSLHFDFSRPLFGCFQVLECDEVTLPHGGVKQFFQIITLKFKVIPKKKIHDLQKRLKHNHLSAVEGFVEPHYVITQLYVIVTSAKCNKIIISFYNKLLHLTFSNVSVWSVRAFSA